MCPFYYFSYLFISLMRFTSADDIKTATVDIESQNLQETAFPTQLNQTNATEPMNMINTGNSLQICTTMNSQTGITISGGPLNNTYWLYCLYINYNDSESGSSGILYEGNGTPVTAVSYWISKDFSNIMDATANAYGVFVLLKPIQIVQNYNGTFDAEVGNVNETNSSATINSDDVLQFYGIDSGLDYYYVCTTLSEFILTDSHNENTANQDTTNQSTTDQSTTDQSTTDQSTTDQSTTDQSTTHQSTTNQSTTNQSTTNQNTTNQNTTHQNTTEQNTISVWYEITIVTPSWYSAIIAEDTYYNLVNSSQLANGQSTDSSTNYYTLPDTVDVYYALNQPMTRNMAAN